MSTTENKGLVPRGLAPAALLLLGLVLAGMLAVAPDHGAALAAAANPLALTVTKQAAPTRVVHGGPVTYTVAFTNTGGAEAHLDAVTDTLPAGLAYDAILPGDIDEPPALDGQELAWTGPFTVPAGSGLRLVYRAESTTATGWQRLCNQVRAATSIGPIGPASACVEVGPASVRLYLPVVNRRYEPAHFTLAKTVAPTGVFDAAGQVVTYTVVIANTGGEQGTVAAVDDTLPQGFSFQAMAVGSDVAAAPSGTSGTITWTGPFQINAKQQLRLIYRAAASQTVGRYWNRVSLDVSAGIPPTAAAAALVTVSPSVLLQEDFDSGIERWTPFLNYHRLQPGQWYWGQSNGVDGSGALTHNCCTGSEVAGDAVMMYLEPGAQEWTDYRVETKLKLTGGVDKYGNFQPNGGDPIGLWVRGHYQPGSPGDGKWLSGYYVLVVGKGWGDTPTEPPRLWLRVSQMRQPGDCGTECRELGQFAFNNPMIVAESEILPRWFEHDRWYTLAVEVRGNRIQAWLDGEKLIDFTDTVLPYMSGTVGYKIHETKEAIFDDLVVTPLW